MVARTPQPTEATSDVRRVNGIPVQKKGAQEEPGQSKRASTAQKSAQDVAGLKDFQLGDCLGKGAFGSVYRALNMGTGETVAVKQIKLADLPKSELRVIMLEIDLLKNLDHPNIVKYHGFVKSAETLNIILEYCENGSLHSISKNFGKFPENLVGLYMSQVLHGLLYLHEQGVIHRDIKGANILTTKQGLVKLADFGVATTATGLHESSVVGTPYWMAPEVIELSGATTASDIWSLGCTVIELLDGKPPYYKLQPMPALFRIVNDDHPPLPEGASPAVRDFLMQCFQKDPNLRVSARKLLKHPWIVSARRSDSVVPKKPTEYEEAVKSVQEWNEALKSPNASSLRKASRPMSSSPVPARRESPAMAINPAKGALHLSKVRTFAEQFRSPESTRDDNWDDDFASAISPSALQLPHLRPHDNFNGMLSSEKLKAYASFEPVTEEENWDNNFEGELTVKSPMRLIESDPLQTIRPYMPTKADSKQSKKTSPMKSAEWKSPKRVTQRAEPRQLRQPQSKFANPQRSATVVKHSSAENSLNLIASNDGILEGAPKSDDSLSPKLFHPSDLQSLPRFVQPPRFGGSLRRHPPPPRQPSMRRARSSVEIQRYAEDEHDEDFSDVFGKGEAVLDRPESDQGSDSGTLMLQSKLSNSSWLGDDDDEDDPFAQLEEGFDEMDLEANIARDKYARLCTQIEGLVSSLKTTQAEDVLLDISEQLMDVLSDSPETKNVIIGAHGMLPMLEILDTCRRRDVILRLLKIVNAIIFSDVEIQENLCFVGGIPIITKFASKKYSSEIRLEAAAFVRQMYQTSTLTLQMFVSCGGLNVLVEFLEEDYEDERDLVLIGVNGVWSVFELQGPTPKNDFCRIFSRNSVLDPLSLVLSRVLDEEGELAELCEGRIANIFLLFSQAENHVKEIVADRTVLYRVLRDLRRMSPNHQITMLKFIKNLSMLSTTLDSLQNANAIDTLIALLRSSTKEPHFREISNQVLNTLYNLCRLSKPRQEDAALNGVIPVLQRIVNTERPLKEFALPILCDMAHSGKVGRRELWKNKGLSFYISLLADPYWQVTALDAIFIWLQEETAKVEEHLLDGSFTSAIVSCFTTSKANFFEGLLEPLQKLLRLSPLVASSLAHPDMFSRLLQKLQTHKPVIRLNLLRILRSICEASYEYGGAVGDTGVLDAVQRLVLNDPAVLVRNMAGELVKSCEENEKLSMNGSRRRTTRRTSATSFTTTPPSLIGSQSMPPTPTSHRSTQSNGYFDTRENRPRNGISSSIPFRPTSRDGSSLNGSLGFGSGYNVAAKSRLPRTTSTRSPRQSMLGSPKREESSTVSGVPVPVSSVPNSRRRRHASGESRWT